MHVQISACAGSQPTHPCGLKRTVSAPGSCRAHQHKCIPEDGASHQLGLKLLFQSRRYTTMFGNMALRSPVNVI